MELSKPEMNKNWYAIFTKPRSEKKVFERLQTAGFEAYLPLIKTVRQWSDRKKTVELPLISSYVFVFIEAKNLNTTLPTPGVVNVLKHLGKPAVIREDEINNLKILTSSDENLSFADSIEVSKGDAVEVVKGPFMGLIATCINTSTSYRVVVKIDSLGTCFNVNIPLSFLRKIEHKTTA